MSTGHRGVAFSWSFLPRPPGRVARDPRVRVERGAHAVETRLLARGRLIEPLLVCRLFRGRRRPSGLKGPKEWDAPRVEPRLAACDEARPLEGDHRTAVADELAPEAPRDGSREELSRLELLDRERGLRLGPRARGVVALERKEDDEAQQHREPRREHAEDACGTVAVDEVALRRSEAAGEQEEPNCGGDRGRDEKCRLPEVHGGRRRRFARIATSSGAGGRGESSDRHDGLMPLLRQPPCGGYRLAARPPP